MAILRYVGFAILVLVVSIIINIIFPDFIRNIYTNKNTEEISNDMRNKLGKKVEEIGNDIKYKLEKYDVRKKDIIPRQCVPYDPRQNISEHHRKDIKITAETLFKVGKISWSFQNEENNEVQNLYEKYPNADIIITNKMLMYYFCLYTYEETNLSSEEKYNKFISMVEHITELSKAIRLPQKIDTSKNHKHNIDKSKLEKNILEEINKPDNSNTCLQSLSIGKCTSVQLIRESDYKYRGIAKFENGTALNIQAFSDEDDYRWELEFPDQISVPVLINFMNLFSKKNLNNIVNDYKDSWCGKLMLYVIKNQK